MLSGATGSMAPSMRSSWRLCLAMRPRASRFPALEPAAGDLLLAPLHRGASSLGIVPGDRTSGRSFRVVSGRHRLRNPLRNSGLSGNLRSRSGRLSSGQRYAGALASGHGTEDRPQPTSAGSETLSPEVDLTVWLAGLGRPGSLGNRRATPWGCRCIPSRQIGRHTAISISPRKIPGQPSGYRRA